MKAGRRRFRIILHCDEAGLTEKNCRVLCRLKHNKEESMKKMLLIAGITLIITGVLSLMYAALNLFGYYHVLDGSADLYSRRYRRMITFGLSGIVLAIFGAVCFIVRLKK